MQRVEQAVLAAKIHSCHQEATVQTAGAVVAAVQEQVRVTIQRGNCCIIISLHTEQLQQQQVKWLLHNCMDLLKGGSILHQFLQH